jgi:UTP--glucose-1-phosphate uridylyltransferase
MLVESEEVCACEIDGIRYDAGDKAGYLKAVLTFALRDEELKGEILRSQQHARS